jgi:hypothetical protein
VFPSILLVEFARLGPEMLQIYDSTSHAASCLVVLEVKSQVLCIRYTGLILTAIW